MANWLLLVLLLPFWPVRCDRRELASPSVSHPATDGPRRAASEDETGRGPVRMELLDPAADPPTWVLRGPRGTEKLVFLHGMCGHGLGYAQAFQFSAARWGTLIAPQADIRCGAGPWAKWSGQLDALDARIQEAFRALGHPEPVEDIAVMGYSQGATRAEQLARRFPKRYTRLVSMAAPQTPSARGLSLHSAVMMAGERDRQDLMKAGSRALLASGIPTTYMMIPEATHGAMGPVPEQTMGAALDWLFRHSRQK
jgi:pimeloyl-ACP methyl ester carboxylesterase